MVRFVGVKNNHICLVSDKPFDHEGLQILEVPFELSDIRARDLIVNCRVKDSKIKCKNFQKSADQLKLALVGNYGTKCGIGTYSKFLYDELTKYVGDYKLFIETQDKYEIENPQISDNKIIACWKRGEKLSELIDEIKKYDPDIVLFQHEFGLWPNARYWLSMISQLSDYRIIVVMHSVFPNHQDKIIYEASMPEIIVHLDGAKKNLENDKNINANVYVIPHGCYPIVNQNKLWDNYKSPHTIIQQGFLFRYKGWQLSLKAIAILKEKYPNIFFTGLCSESPYAKIDHQIYYNELMLLVDKLGVNDNISLIRGFQSEIILDTFYRSNKIAIFPYVSSLEHAVFGASGAARLAMSKGLPVITSSVNHFSDLNTIKADTPEQIAKEIDKLFCSEELIKQQIEKQNNFINENSWENIAKRYIEIFEK
jgi:glycosyltransferase involved in cell wall biosynthesis